MTQLDTYKTSVTLENIVGTVKYVFTTGSREVEQLVFQIVE